MSRSGNSGPKSVSDGANFQRHTPGADFRCGVTCRFERFEVRLNVPGTPAVWVNGRPIPKGGKRCLNQLIKHAAEQGRSQVECDADQQTESPQPALDSFHSPKNSSRVTHVNKRPFSGVHDLFGVRHRRSLLHRWQSRKTFRSGNRAGLVDES
jgi:hypothetical protein